MIEGGPGHLSLQMGGKQVPRPHAMSLPSPECCLEPLRLTLRWVRGSTVLVEGHAGARNHEPRAT